MNRLEEITDKLMQRGFDVHVDDDDPYVKRSHISHMVYSPHENICLPLNFENVIESMDVPDYNDFKKTFPAFVDAFDNEYYRNCTSIDRNDQGCIFNCFFNFLSNFIVIGNYVVLIGYNENDHIMSFRGPGGIYDTIFIIEINNFANMVCTKLLRIANDNKDDSANELHLVKKVNRGYEKPTNVYDFREQSCITPFAIPLQPHPILFDKFFLYRLTESLPRNTKPVEIYAAIMTYKIFNDTLKCDKESFMYKNVITNTQVRNKLLNQLETTFLMLNTMYLQDTRCSLDDKLPIKLDKFNNYLESHKDTQMLKNECIIELIKSVVFPYVCYEKIIDYTKPNINVVPMSFTPTFYV